MALDFKNIKINETEESQPLQNQLLPEQDQVLSPELQTPSTTEPEPTHFDSLINNAPIEQVGDNALIMKPDEFHKLFCMAFNTGSAVSGLKSLAVDGSDGSVVACTEAIHEMCLEIPAMRFLIQPQGKWGTRIFAIGAFAVPMALAVTAEVKERRQSAQMTPTPSGHTTINPADIKF